jgi:hypothetical protein
MATGLKQSLTASPSNICLISAGWNGLKIINSNNTFSTKLMIDVQYNMRINKSMNTNTSKISSWLYFMFLTVTLFGCSKTIESEKFAKDPVVMIFNSLEPKFGMRLFTDGGAVLNQRIDGKTIQNYLDRDYGLKTNSGERFYQSKFFEPTFTDDYEKTSFTFYNDGRISYGAEIINIKNLGDTRILKSMVTNKIEDDPIVTSELFKYKFDTSSNGTYNYQYIVHGDERHTDVSLLYYKLVRYDDKGNLKSLAFGTVHNELNESFVKTLDRYDTLAVKAYTIRYSVK